MIGKHKHLPLKEQTLAISENGKKTEYMLNTSLVCSLHMAGTETATIWTGYMSGAIQAGQRAALEILQQLKPHAVSHNDILQNNRLFKPTI